MTPEIVNHSKQRIDETPSPYAEAKKSDWPGRGMGGEAAADTTPKDL
jgi:hypothetical protein